jgi:hypothetical protein
VYPTTRRRRSTPLHSWAWTAPTTRSSLVLVVLILAAAPAAAQVSRISDDLSLGWYSYTDLTAQRFGELFQQLRDQGLMMVDTEAYPAGNSTRYAMVWTANPDGRGWAAYRDMTADAYGERWRQFSDQGWRPIDIEAYPTASGLRYAGIWIENRERLRWASRRDMTGASTATGSASRATPACA